MNINTKEYWDGRFESGSWEENNGFAQSEYFGNIIYDLISKEVKDNMKNSTLLDYGCACGQVANIFSNIDGIKITGFDLSDKAIDIARKLFNHIDFVYDKPTEQFDTILFSHILEHMEDGIDFVRQLTNQCNKYVIISTPYMEDKNNLISEHMVSINDDYFPIIINDFIFKEGVVVDTRKSGFWHGDVIVIVYEKYKSEVTYGE